VDGGVAEIFIRETGAIKIVPLAKGTQNAGGALYSLEVLVQGKRTSDGG